MHCSGYAGRKACFSSSHGTRQVQRIVVFVQAVQGNADESPEQEGVGATVILLGERECKLAAEPFEKSCAFVYLHLLYR